MKEKIEFRVIFEIPGKIDYEIRPLDINTVNHFIGAFGKYEIEEAARNIIGFCQKRNAWCGFKIKELLHYYYYLKRNPDFMFYGLLGYWQDDSWVAEGYNEAPPCLVLCADGLYRVTDFFINRCAGKQK